MKNWSLIIQIIHLICAIICPFIPIFTSKYDMLYIISVFLVPFHWNIFNGECIASYFEKKVLDSNYKLGDAKESLFKQIIGEKTTDIMTSTNLIGILIVLHRNYGTPNFRSMFLLMVVATILRFSSYNIKFPRNKF